MQPFPPILCPPQRALLLTSSARLLALAVAAGCVALLLVATRARPSPTGIGTHRQLGMERCQFEAQTGVPCPTCGMTTSYAHFVRGQWIAAFYVQPMAALMALATCMSAWAGLYIALTGRPIHRLFYLLRARYYVTAVLSLAVLAWAWKIWIHLHGIDGWR